MENCRHCGKTLPEGADSCPNCGYSRPWTRSPEAESTTGRRSSAPRYTEAEFVLEDEEGVVFPAGHGEAAPEERDTAPGARTEEPAAGGPDRREREVPSAGADRREPEQGKKASKLAVAAFICSLTLVFSGLGVILAIVDLAKARGGGKKHRLSIAALVIGGAFLLLSTVGRVFVMPKLLAETDTAQTAAAVQPAPQRPSPTLPPVQAQEPIAAPEAPAAIPAPEPTPEPWDWLEAEDDEIRALMDNYLEGYDAATDYKCAFFFDDNLERGGFYCWKQTGTSLEGWYAVGTFVEQGSDFVVLLTTKGRSEYQVKVNQDGSIQFNFHSGEEFPDGFRLTPGELWKDDVLRRLLATKKAVNTMP